MSFTHQFQTLLVDDQKISRRVLRHLLAGYPDIVIAGEAENVEEAERLANKLHPDVIFLDISMPGQDGFSLFSRLESSCHIIFMTSHEQYAVRGFEFNALDYLVKPVQAARLKKSITRLRDAQTREKKAYLAPPLNTPVVIGDLKHRRTIPVGEITLIQAQENYAWIHTSGRTAAPLLMRRNLAAWEKLLPTPSFVRIDRAQIVNLLHLQNFHSVTREESYITLAGVKEPVCIGRTAQTRLREALRKLNKQV